MIKQSSRMVGNFLEGLSYASSFGLYRYLWISGFISLLIGGTIFGMAYGFSDDIGSLLVSWWPWEWGKSIISFLAEFTGGVIILSIGLILYKYLIIILLGPVMSPLSERIERKWIGEEARPVFSGTRIVTETSRGIWINVRNMTKELFYTVVLLLISLFPGAFVFTTPLILLIQCYYAGFGNFDYFLERHLVVKDSVRFVKQHRGASIVNGGFFLGLLFIPILGLFIAPFLSTIAATTYCLESGEF